MKDNPWVMVNIICAITCVFAYVLDLVLWKYKAKANEEFLEELRRLGLGKQKEET